jgi:predicted ATP-dependent Lon-type protease
VTKLEEHNDELQQKLDKLLNEHYVLKQENEVIKSKARKMLEDKDSQIERLKGGIEEEKIQEPTTVVAPVD